MKGVGLHFEFCAVFIHLTLNGIFDLENNKKVFTNFQRLKILHRLGICIPFEGWGEPPCENMSV